MVSGVGFDKVEVFWKEVEPLIEKALDERITTDDVFKWVKSRDVQLWIVYSDEIIAACTTQIVNFPRSKTCRILALGGSRMSEWLEDLEKVLCRWAKEQGCSHMDCPVRDGLVKTLRPLGYEKLVTLIGKKLDG